MMVVIDSRLKVLRIVQRKGLVWTPLPPLPHFYECQLPQFWTMENQKRESSQKHIFCTHVHFVLSVYIFYSCLYFIMWNGSFTWNTFTNSIQQYLYGFCLVQLTCQDNNNVWVTDVNAIYTFWDTEGFPFTSVIVRVLLEPTSGHPKICMLMYVHCECVQHTLVYTSL